MNMFPFSSTSWLDDDCKRYQHLLSTQTPSPRKPKEPRHNCPHCQMVFKDTWHLRRHLSTHENNDKPTAEPSESAAEVLEIIPKCRLCGKEVTKAQFALHSLEHVDEIFEEVKAGRACSACHVRRQQAYAVLQVLNGRFNVPAEMVRGLSAKN